MLCMNFATNSIRDILKQIYHVTVFQIIHIYDRFVQKATYIPNMVHTICKLPKLTKIFMLQQIQIGFLYLNFFNICSLKIFLNISKHFQHKSF